MSGTRMTQITVQNLSVLKRFEFSSPLQRMSVITLNKNNGSLVGFVKGSPEMIHSLCVENTLPKDYFEVLETYTKDGLRVLALAYKSLPELTQEQVKTYKRESIE